MKPRTESDVDNKLKILPAAKHRMSFGQFIDKLLWFLVTSCAIYMSSQIREMGQNISLLNANMAVVLYSMTESKEWRMKVEGRQDRLEERILSCERQR